MMADFQNALISRIFSVFSSGFLHRTTLNRIFIKFFSVSLGFARFFRSDFGLQILMLKEFNKTIIPFALVGYETGYLPFNKTIIPFALVGYETGYLPSHIQCALMK